MVRGLFFAVLMALDFGAAMQAQIPVVLSTDIGNEIDDQWAVVALLTQPEFDVRGILSAYAPSLPDPAAHSSLLLLREVVEKRLGLAVHPPLIEGAGAPLLNRTSPQESAAARFLLSASKGFTPQHRLTVLVIGAATDMASALLMDPSIADRVHVVAMAFNNFGPRGANEYNELNDPKAWQVLLRSGVPLTVGTGDVCRQGFSLNYAQAEHLLQNHGPIAAWLWDDYRRWYFRNVKPLRVGDYSKPWVIWDLITVAYVRGMVKTEQRPRPILSDAMEFQPGSSGASIENIIQVDTPRVWADFVERIDAFQATHAVPPFPVD